MLLVCPNHNYEATHKLPYLSSECVGEHSLITVFNLSDKCLMGILCPLTLLSHNDELWKRLLSSLISDTAKLILQLGYISDADLQFGLWNRKL